MSSPSISVMNCGRAFSFASTFAPIVLGRPIARQRLNRRELHALRCIRDRFPLRPPCRVYAPAQFGEFRFRNIHMKRTNRILVICLLAALWRTNGLGHGVLHLSSFGIFWFVLRFDSCVAIVSFLKITFAAIQQGCCDHAQGLHYAERNVSKILLAQPHPAQLIG